MNNFNVVNDIQGQSATQPSSGSDIRQNMLNSVPVPAQAPSGIVVQQNMARL